LRGVAASSSKLPDMSDKQKTLLQHQLGFRTFAKPGGGFFQANPQRWKKCDKETETCPAGTWLEILVKREQAAGPTWLSR